MANAADLTNAFVSTASNFATKVELNTKASQDSLNSTNSKVSELENNLDEKIKTLEESNKANFNLKADKTQLTELQNTFDVNLKVSKDTFTSELKELKNKINETLNVKVDKNELTTHIARIDKIENFINTENCIYDVKEKTLKIKLGEYGGSGVLLNTKEHNGKFISDDGESYDTKYNAKFIFNNISYGIIIKERDDGLGHNIYISKTQKNINGDDQFIISDEPGYKQTIFTLLKQWDVVVDYDDDEPSDEPTTTQQPTEGIITEPLVKNIVENNTLFLIFDDCLLSTFFNKSLVIEFIDKDDSMYNLLNGGIKEFVELANTINCSSQISELYEKIDDEISELNDRISGVENDFDERTTQRRIEALLFFDNIYTNMGNNSENSKIKRREILRALIESEYFKNLIFDGVNGTLALTLGTGFQELGMDSIPSSVLTGRGVGAYPKFFRCNDKYYSGVTSSNYANFTIYHLDENNSYSRIEKVSYINGLRCRASDASRTRVYFTPLNEDLETWFTKNVPTLFIDPDFEKEILEGEECGMKDLMRLLSFRDAFKT